MINLEGALNVAKTAWYNAANLQSDRYESPKNTLCSNWRGTDLYGRPVNFNSFGIETAGCLNPNRRIQIENSQRPRYFEYVGYSVPGLYGQIYNGPKQLENRYNTPNYTIIGENYPLIDDPIHADQIAYTGQGYNAVRKSGSTPNTYSDKTKGYKSGLWRDEDVSKYRQLQNSRIGAEIQRTRSGF